MWRKVSPWAPGVQRHVRSFMFLDQQLMLKGFSGGTGEVGIGAEVWAGHGQGEGGLAGCQPGAPPWSRRRMDRADVGSSTCPALLRMVYGSLQDLMPTLGAHAPQLVPVYPLFSPRPEGP